MAVEIKFLDKLDPKDYVKANHVEQDTSQRLISINGCSNNEMFAVWLDKKTAIKLAKRIRTLIHEITLDEGGYDG